jgi:hypothetical protein
VLHFCWSNIISVLFHGHLSEVFNIVSEFNFGVHLVLSSDPFRVSQEASTKLKIELEEIGFVPVGLREHALIPQEFPFVGITGRGRLLSHLFLSIQLL